MREMGELQALVTGVIAGGLMAQQEITVDVEVVTDEDGYLPEVRVVGRNSGEQLLVRVEQVSPPARRTL